MRKIKNILLSTLLCIAHFSIPIVHADDDQTTLEDDFVLEDQAFGNDNIFNANNPINIHGFASVGGVKASNDLNISQRIDDKMGYRADTNVGIQFQYGLSEETSFILQLAATGINNFDIKADWAYVQHQYSENISVKLGRLRQSIYFYSESVDVGFSYPWIRPPLEIYRATDNSFEGIELNYDFTLGSTFSTLQFFTGDGEGVSENPVYVETPEFTGFVHVLDEKIDTDDQWGINLISNWDFYTFRVGYLTFDASATIIAEVFGTLVSAEEQQESEYYSTAMLYDNAKWYFIVEWARLNAKSVGQIPDYDSGYFSIGYHYRDYLPYMTFGVINQVSEASDRSETQGFQSNSFSLGLRYDISANMSAKFEANRYFDFQGGTGPLGSRNDSNDGDVWIAGFVIDVVF